MFDKVQEVITQSENVLKGKKEQVKLVVSNILANGHTLLEDVPGVGKTTLVKYLSKSCGLKVSRIQFTNDLLPADIIGSSIFNKATNSFDFHQGPLFGELVLADELNRAPPKTQSSLLQAMEERSITVEGKTYPLPPYFTVIATQNPHAQIGTYDLPESQLDRFSIKLKMGYADKNSTLAFLKDSDTEIHLEQTKKILEGSDLLTLQKQIKQIHIEDSIFDTIYTLLELSRTQSDLIPLSNRCGIDMVNLSKAWAYLEQRDYVIPDDLFYLFPYIAGHRLVHPENSDIEFEHNTALQLIHSL
ncbi:MAG: AAA family ATPase [Halobacteriovoraceae bacterium]|nr:AAA family ATPase [Halobacteriovoraceae bacterium]|tara:strand:- start:17438 stop:18343 length:906 start_codon:yes stop_codon:yes gene_type:complete